MDQIIIFDYFSDKNNCFFTEDILTAFRAIGGRRQVTVHGVLNDGYIYTLKIGKGWIKPRDTQLTIEEVVEKYGSVIFFNRNLNEIDLSTELQNKRWQRELGSQTVMLNISDRTKLVIVDLTQYREISQDVLQILWKNILQYNAPDKNEVMSLFMMGLYKVSTKDTLLDSRMFFDRLHEELGAADESEMAEVLKVGDFVAAQNIFERALQKNPTLRELWSKSIL